MPETNWVVINSSSPISWLLHWQGVSARIQIVMILFVIIWVLSIIRVARDSLARSNKLSTQVLAIMAVTLLSPLIGLPIYLAFRPMRYSHDKLPRREASVMNLIVCYNCAALNPKDHDYCLACWEPLKIKCKQCGKQFAHSYGYCPDCGAPNIE